MVGFDRVLVMFLSQCATCAVCDVGVQSAKEDVLDGTFLSAVQLWGEDKLYATD